MKDTCEKHQGQIIIFEKKDGGQKYCEKCIEAEEKQAKEKESGIQTTSIPESSDTITDDNADKKELF